MHAQWEARPFENKFKKKFVPKRRMDGHPPQSNLIERKVNSYKGQNKRPAVLMFEKQDGKSADLTNDSSLAMENFNYDRDKHSLIDENEFTDNLSKLDPTFVKDVCKSLEERE